MVVQNPFVLVRRETVNQCKVQVTWCFVVR